MWIAVDSVQWGHSWKPEVTYHICGPRAGPGKVPGVESHFPPPLDAKCPPPIPTTEETLDFPLGLFEP